MIRQGRFFRGPIVTSNREHERGYGRRVIAAPKDPTFIVDIGAGTSTFVASAPVITSIGRAYLTSPSPYLVTSYGTALDPNSFSGTLRFSLQAYGGATAALSMPSPIFVATGTGVAIGRAYLTAPSATLNGVGTVSGVGQASLTLASRFRVKAYAGAVAKITLQDGFTLNVTGIAGGLGRGAVTMPLFELVATGTTSSASSAYLTMPAMRAATSGIALLLSPRAMLVAIGTATVTAEYEAYAVNLLEPINPIPGPPTAPQVSHYTNFPFTQIVRFNDSYYGIGEDGIYALGGETDDGAAIAWAFETGKTDFSSKQLKRVSSVYIGGRLAERVTVAVVTGDSASTSLTYSYTAERDAEAQTNRVATGKGLRSRYYSFGLSDTAGNFIEMDTLDLEVEVLERAI